MLKVSEKICIFFTILKHILLLIYVFAEEFNPADMSAFKLQNKWRIKLHNLYQVTIN